MLGSGAFEPRSCVQSCIDNCQSRVSEVLPSLSLSLPRAWSLEVVGFDEQQESPVLEGSVAASAGDHCLGVKSSRTLGQRTLRA